MRTRVILIVGAVVVGSAIGVSGVVNRGSATSHTIKISAEGEHVFALPPQVRELLEAKGWEGLELMATRGDMAFYRVLGGGTCYAVGPAGSVGLVGAVKCFSAGDPIMAFISAEATRDDPKLRVYAAHGVVADGVESVEMTDEDGDRAATADVRNNVFQFERLSVENPGALVARDARGRKLYSQSLRHEP